VLRSERYYGNQYRGFTLPAEVDAARSEANYDDGVLELVLPRKEGTAAKRVTVK
jgi:HSP20 family protein